jgi:hypothetical protein
MLTILAYLGWYSLPEMSSYALLEVGLVIDRCPLVTDSYRSWACGSAGDEMRYENYWSSHYSHLKAPVEDHAVM